MKTADRRGVTRTLRTGGILAGLGLLVSGQAGCATVRQYNRDVPVSARTLRTLAADWTFDARPAPPADSPDRLSSLKVSVQKDKACVVTKIQTVDRTFVTEKTLQNEKRSRNMAYTIGPLGLAGAIPNYVLATQAKDDGDRVLFGVLAGIGTYLSITLFVQIGREIEAIDHEEHIGILDTSEKTRGRCDAQPAAGARVRLLRAGAPALSEGVVDAKGDVVLPLDPSAVQRDAIYTLEVDGRAVQHVELTAPTPALPTPALPAPAPAPPRP